MRLSGARDRDYDGIHYDELDFSAVHPSEEWRCHIEQRSVRKGSPGEVDIQVSWAMEAVGDVARLVRSGRSRSGLTVQLIGRSAAAGRVLAVYLYPAHRPPRDTWYGATARVASARERQDYERQLRWLLISDSSRT